MLGNLFSINIPILLLDELILPFPNLTNLQEEINYFAGKMLKFNNTQKYKHFIVTLFNVRNFLDATKDEKKWLEWTKERIGIFKKYCYPSIEKQTCKEFHWLLYFDSLTPSYLIESVREILNNNQFEIIFKDGIEDFYSTYKNDMLERLDSDTMWIIQTRFDNDDIFNQNAIKTIQMNFKNKHGYIISLASGYTFQLKNQLLSHYFYPMGPFISLIENTQLEMKGIYHCNHWQWPNLRLWIYKEILILLNLKNENAHFVLKQKMWIQLIHENNMHNSSDRGLPVLKQRKLRTFLPNLVSKPSPIRRIIKHIHYVWWKRYFKAYVIYILRIIFNKPD